MSSSIASGTAKPGSKRAQLEQSTVHYEEGWKFHKRSKYDDAIREFNKCLAIRESILGRHHETAKVYYGIGHANISKGDHNSGLIAYRAYLRICRIVGYHINLKHPLEANGMTEEEIKAYDAILTESSNIEKAGDAFREKGDFLNAVAEYERAIELEKDSIGNTVSTAFLWRKIATLLGRRDLFTEASEETKKLDWSVIEWKKIDLIDTMGRKQNVHGLYDEIHQVIQRGDQHHGNAKYKHALKQYQKAAELAKAKMPPEPPSIVAPEDLANDMNTVNQNVNHKDTNDTNDTNDSKDTNDTNDSKDKNETNDTSDTNKNNNHDKKTTKESDDEDHGFQVLKPRAFSCFDGEEKKSSIPREVEWPDSMKKMDFSQNSDWPEDQIQNQKHIKQPPLEARDDLKDTIREMMGYIQELVLTQKNLMKRLDGETMVKRVAATQPNAQQGGGASEPDWMKSFENKISQDINSKVTGMQTKIVRRVDELESAVKILVEATAATERTHLDETLTDLVERVAERQDPLEDDILEPVDAKLSRIQEDVVNCNEKIAQMQQIASGFLDKIDKSSQKVTTELEAKIREIPKETMELVQSNNVNIDKGNDGNSDDGLDSRTVEPPETWEKFDSQATKATQDNTRRPENKMARLPIQTPGTTSDAAKSDENWMVRHSRTISGELDPVIADEQHWKSIPINGSGSHTERFKWAHSDLRKTISNMDTTQRKKMIDLESKIDQMSCDVFERTEESMDEIKQEITTNVGAMLKSQSNIIEQVNSTVANTPNKLIGIFEEKMNELLANVTKSVDERMNQFKSDLSNEWHDRASSQQQSELETKQGQRGIDVPSNSDWYHGSQEKGIPMAPFQNEPSNGFENERLHWLTRFADMSTKLLDNQTFILKIMAERPHLPSPSPYQGFPSPDKPPQREALEAMSMQLQTLLDRADTSGNANMSQQAVTRKPQARTGALRS